MSVPNLVADFKTTLALKVAVAATTATLSSVTDEDGDALPNGFYGFTIDRNNSSKEYITCTLTGTSLSAISTIDRGTGVATSGFALSHRKGAEVIISDFVAIKRIQDIFETGYPSATTPTTDYQLATKKYVDDLALGGSTTVDRVTVVATCGEDVTAGQLLYLKLSDSKWWKTDADTVTTVDNVVLGIAQGAGTANATITGGVLVKGVDPNQTGLTPDSLYYASNTAGAISATSGTITRIIGIATASDKLYFDPEFNKTYKNYAVDAVGTDAYAITLQSAFGALYAGMEVTFKAGTANTGACTLAVNGLTAKAITKEGATALVTGDILANQIVKVVYDGTQFQMVSHIPQSTVPIVRTYLNAASPATWNKPTGLKYVIVEVQAGGGGANSTSDNTGFPGAGGGGYSRKLIAAGTLGSTETVTIGAGGATGNPGATGGTSSFGSHCSATGGEGSASNEGGEGGIGSDGDVNVRGGGGGAMGAASTGSGSGNSMGGASGGSSVLGGGGFGANSGASGGAGGLYGGGGGGGSENPGGAGGAGIVIVTEYYA